MKVTVVGCGYVGLSTGLALALTGHQVRFVDVDEAKLSRLRAGRLPFVEPGLEPVLHQVTERCVFTSDIASALPESDVVLVAVGTPSTPAGYANLTYLFHAVTQVAEHAAEPYPLVVTKSTVPVGTAQELRSLLDAKAPQKTFKLASNPEFLRQGRALHDTLYPERILLGADDDEAFSTLEQLYAPIITQSFTPPADLPRPTTITDVPVVRTGVASAELAKYAANAFLATKISFINEIANVCDSVGADIREVAEVVGMDTRIGPHFLQAGLGYGGSCFPKDTRALAQIATRGGYSFKLLNAVIEVNNAQRYRIVEKAEQLLGNLHQRDIVLLGLTFKPGTDDLRDAPSLDIAHELLSRGAKVRAHDPVALDAAGALFGPDVTLYDSPLDALSGADAAILVTEWDDYISLDWAQAYEAMRYPLVLDGRNALDAEALRQHGFFYQGMGRGHADPRRLADVIS